MSVANTRRQIGVDDLVPEGVGDRFDRALRVPFAGHRKEARARIDAGIGEDHIQPAALLDHLVDGRCDRGAIGDVDRAAVDIAPRAQLGNRSAQRFPITIEQRDARTVVHHGFGERAAKALGPAGDRHGQPRNVEELLRLHFEVPVFNDQRRIGSLPSQSCAAAK